jgi:polyisoprenoid-binding protein YceI
MRATNCLQLAVLLALAAADPAAASEWSIDSGKSWLGFEGTMGQSAFKGRFEHWEGRISFDAAHPDQGRVSVKIDMHSARTGDPQKDDALPRSDWFAAERFPAADFEVQSFQPTGGASYRAIGTLTIRDVSKPVAMPVTIDASDTTLHATGSLDLMRSDYGVGQGTWAGGQWVGLGVTAQFDVTATRVN